MHMCQRCRTPTKTPVKRRRVMVETPSPQPKRRRPCECPPSSDSSSECPPSPSPDSNSECPPPSADDIAIDRIQSILNNLKDGALESTLMKIADRVKVTIVGKTCSLKELIHAATTAEAAPQVHAVIADECIRLRVGRREYTKVIVPAYRKIRDAIKWVDVPGAEFCPRWGDMKKTIDCELAKGVNKGVHTVKPTWRAGGLGCVWTEVDVYIAERMIAYRSKLPTTYRNHLETIAARVSTVSWAGEFLRVFGNTYEYLRAGQNVAKIFDVKLVHAELNCWNKH